MKAITQAEHTHINAQEYPGTRQLCCICDEPTGQCEDDSIYLDLEYENQGSIGPLCEKCAKAIMEEPK